MIGDKTKMATVAVCEAAKVMLKAKSEFAKCWIHFWSTVQPLNDTDGFRILDVLIAQVQRYYFDYKRHDVGIKHAANEVFRLVAVGQAEYTMEDALQFVKWYSRTKNLIGQAIADLYDYHGDSFSDLCDALPLAGKDIVRRCLATDPESKKPKRDGFLDSFEIPTAVEEKLGKEWRKLICTGENYVASALEHEARKWWLFALWRGEIPGGMTEEETQATNYAFYCDD